MLIICFFIPLVTEVVLHLSVLILVARFQHSHPFAAGSFANVRIKRTTSKIMVLVELLDLTFASRTRG
jgi:hypothetical protein